MTPEEQAVYDYLDSLGIPYTRYEHPPVYTVEQAEEHWETIEGTHCKNLFFRNKKGNKHYLVIVKSDKRVDIKDLGKKTGAGNLSFASERRLKEHLGLSPGAVTPFGLLNDADGNIRVFIDKDLEDVKDINFHPNVNTATVRVSNEDFKKFLASRGNSVEYVKV